MHENISQNVVFSKASLSHEDARRSLFSVFDGGEFGKFKAAHLKWFEFKRDSAVGGHYHEYAELFCVLKGRGLYETVPIDGYRDGLSKKFELQRLDVLYIPKRFAHKGFVQAGSIILACNSEPYFCAEKSDKPFRF